MITVIYYYNYIFKKCLLSVVAGTLILALVNCFYPCHVISNLH